MYLTKFCTFSKFSIPSPKLAAGTTQPIEILLCVFLNWYKGSGRPNTGVFSHAESKFSLYWVIKALKYVAPPEGICCIPIMEAFWLAKSSDPSAYGYIGTPGRPVALLACTSPVMRPYLLVLKIGLSAMVLVSL